VATGLSELDIRRIDDVYGIIIAVRRAIDIHSPRYRDTEDFQNQREIINDFESLRFTLRALRSRSRLNEANTGFLLSEAKLYLDKVVSNPSMERFAGARYRPIPRNPQAAPNQLIFELEGQESSNFDALQRCRDIIESMLEDSPDEVRFSSSVLRSIIPEQKIAPTRFEIVGDKIKVCKDSSLPREGSEEIAAISREEAIAQNDHIVTSLDNSNCHPVLRKAFAGLGDKLRSNANAIRVGMEMITCEALLSQFSNEIPDGVVGLMIGHLRSISMIIGQYEDWRTFCENAIEADLDSGAQGILAHAAEEIAATLERNPGLSDPDVPKTLLFLKECINNPKMAVSRTGYAALATIENLISAIYTYAKDFINDTVRHSIKTASIALGGVVGLASLGLLGAELIAPVANLAQGGQWVIELVKVLKAP